jgi:hypothetical protein
MPKTSRRNRIKNRSSDFQNEATPSVEQVTVNKPKIVTPTFDATQYIKKDLMWSGLTAGIVVVVLIVAYIFLR